MIHQKKSLFSKIMLTLLSPILVPLTEGMTFKRWFAETWGDG